VIGRAPILKRFWRNHSLTIILWGVSMSFIAGAFLFEPGRVFDLLLGVGHGAFTVALLNSLSGRFRERNKAEEKPRLMK
jgi:hypothetical protein